MRRLLLVALLVAVTAPAAVTSTPSVVANEEDCHLSSISVPNQAIWAPKGASAAVLSSNTVSGTGVLRRLFPQLRLDLEETRAALDDAIVDEVLAALALLVGELVHQVEHDLLAHRPQRPRPRVALQRTLGDQLQRARREFQVAVLHVKDLAVLLHERVLRLRQDRDQRLDVQRLQRRDQRQARIVEGVFRIGLLAGLLDAWIDEKKNGPLFDNLYQKYFIDRRRYLERVTSEYLTSKTGKLCEFDPLLKQYATELNWDWRLLAAQAFQESRFKPAARSWAGGAVRATGTSAR